MNAVQGYFLGILTVVAIFFTFWVLSMYSKSVSRAYKSVVCDQAI